MKTGYVDGLPFRQVTYRGSRAGWGPSLFSYVVYVEEGTGVHLDKFARQVEVILADDRGWIRGGKVSFQRVAEGGNTSLILAKPNTVDKLCYPLNTEGEVSCCQGTKVVINLDRWKNAVPHWKGSLRSYRQMLINHEFGHRTGKTHRWCSEVGDPAPCMMQQTYGLQGCRENSWPLDYEL